MNTAACTEHCQLHGKNNGVVAVYGKNVQMWGTAPPHAELGPLLINEYIPCVDAMCRWGLLLFIPVICDRQLDHDYNYY